MKDVIKRVHSVAHDASFEKWQWMLNATDMFSAYSTAKMGATATTAAPKAQNQHSPHFEVGGVRWRILAQPGKKHLGVFLERGTGEKRSVDAHFQFTTSIINEPKTQSDAEPLLQPCDTSRNVFSNSANTLGFNSHAPYSLIFEPDNAGLSYPFLHTEDNDGQFAHFVKISVSIKIARVDGEHFSVYKGKISGENAIQPFKGIVNQGATCYLNSLLQTLFHLKVFRKLTFALGERVAREAEEKDEFDTLRKSIPFCLSRLFYELQRNDTEKSDVTVRTSVLTDSFGWGRSDALEQHDVQEMARKLIDGLENKMKGMPGMETVLKNLFLGRVRNFVKCIDFDFQSSRTEEYYDIQLCVRGCKTLKQAFKQELKQELMQGDNAYRAIDEATGLNQLSSAKKGIEWLQFPPILFLHLRRFEYDYAKDSFTKVSDRLEFPETLDLTEYLKTESKRSSSNPPDSMFTSFNSTVPLFPTPNSSFAKRRDEASEQLLNNNAHKQPPTRRTPQHANHTPLVDQASPGASPRMDTDRTNPLHPSTPPPAPKPQIYRLHSVLVHSGSAVGGHYYAFIRPVVEGAGGKWYCFDDSTVREVPREEAVDENFGHAAENDEKFWLNSSKNGVSTSAYMLVYIKESRLGEVLTAPAAASPALQRSFQQFDSNQSRSQCAQQTAAASFTFHITRDADLVSHNRSMRFQHPDLKQRFWLSKTPLTIKKNATWKELTKAINSHIGRDGKLRVLLWQWRTNQTERLYGPLISHNTSAHTPHCTKLSDSVILSDIFSGSDYINDGKPNNDFFDSVWTPLQDAPREREREGPSSPKHAISTGDILLSDPYGPTDSNASSVTEGGSPVDTSPQAMREQFFATAHLGNNIFIHVEEAKPLKPDEVYLSVKLFTEKDRGMLTYQGSVTLAKTKKISDLSKEVASLTGAPKGATAHIFEERRASLVLPLAKPGVTLAACGLETGDIIIVQYGAATANGPGKVLHEATQKMEVTLMEVNDECPVVKAVLSRDDRYAQCVACVVRSVDVDPAYVRLLRVQTPVREEAHATVTAAELVSHDNVLRYEVTSLPVAEIAQSLEVSFAHFEKAADGRLAKKAEMAVILRKNSTVRDLVCTGADRLAAKNVLDKNVITNPSQQLVAMRVCNGRITHILRSSDPIRPHMSGDATFRTELRRNLVIPPQPRGRGSSGSPTAQRGAVLVSVCHFVRAWPGSHIIVLHSSPFVTTLQPEDTENEFLLRCAGCIGISKQARLKGWTLCLLQVLHGREVVVGEIVGNVLNEVSHLTNDDDFEGATLEATERQEPFTLLLGLERRNETRKVESERGVQLNM